MSDSSNTGNGGSDGTDGDKPARAFGLDVSEEEVDALLEERAAAERSDVPRAYDLVAGAVRYKAPVLDRVNERWIAAYSQRLSTLVRQELDVSLDGVKVVPYAEWQAALPMPSSVDVYEIEPWAKSAIVALEGELLFLLVDACYGGSGRPSRAARMELTPAELHMKEAAARALIEEMRRAFEPIASLTFRHEKTELGPRYVAIATPSESVVVTRVAVGLKGIGGTLHVVIPLSAFESVTDALAEGVKSVSSDTRKRWRGEIESRLDETELELACVFLTTQLTVRDLLRLRPGDILPIEMPKTAALHAGSKPLLLGKFGQSRGYNAVRIIEAVKPPPRQARTDEGKRK